MGIKFISVIFLFFSVEAFKGVKIDKISVPSYFLKTSDNKPLVLECDFTIDEKVQGFVLKWLHDSKGPVYQWIPPNSPYALGTFRNRIDLNYIASNDTFKKHSAMVIKDVSVLDTGNYTCDIQTFVGFDKMTSKMVVIHPEQSINLKYNIDNVEQIVSLECTIYNIYPLPDVKFLFNEEEKSISVDVDTNLSNNLYNVTLTTQLSKNDIQDESEVTCWMKIMDTEYERRKTIIYDENDGMRFLPNFEILFVVLMNVLIGRIL